MSRRIRSKHFEIARNRTGRVEGGYVNNPNDLGGPTNHGVTEQTARRHEYEGDMRDFTAEMADQVFFEDYWRAMHLDAIAKLSPPIAYELFDSAVNMTGPGGHKIGRWLQGILNSGNYHGKFYTDLVVDGKIGPATVKALAAYLKRRGWRGEIALFCALNGEQVHHYNKITIAREQNEEFWFGWIWHRVVVDLFNIIMGRIQASLLNS